MMNDPRPGRSTDFHRPIDAPRIHHNHFVSKRRILKQASYAIRLVQGNHGEADERGFLHLSVPVVTGIFV
jgi:hypothetical protein